MSQPAVAPSAAPRLLTVRFALTCAAIFFLFGSFFLLMPAIPLYVLEAGGSEGEVGLVVGAFSVSSLLLRPPVGRGVDRRGRWPFLLAGCLVFVASSLLYPAARTVPRLVLLRVVHGAGIACFSTAANTSLADLAPPSGRGRAMGYSGMFLNLSVALAPALGALLLQARGFLSVFLAAAGSAVVALVCSALLGETAPAGEAARPEGAARGPLVSRPALFPSAVLLLSTTTYGAVVTFLPLLAAERRLGSPGLFFAVYAAGVIAARLVAGPASDRLGRGVTTPPGLLGMALAMAVLAAAGSRAGMALAAALYGLGLGALLPDIQALTVDRAPGPERGAAMATLSSAFDLGIALGAGCLGWLLPRGGFGLLFCAAGLPAAAALPLFALGRRRGL
ncbi:MAG: MFS transporter [Acetobacteraceae bacterium]|nr:MFS transporter [Acetobacteraceae bacterium]